MKFRTLLLALVPLLFSGPLAAQSWTLLGGAGGIEHESRLGRAYHLNLRREIAGWTDIRLPSLEGLWTAPALRIEAEALAHRGRSGVGVALCDTDGSLCSVGADPLYLAGGGFTAKVEATRPDRAVQLYFLPVTVGAMVRGADLYTALLGPEGTRESVREARLVGAFGNGLGVHVRVGGVQTVAELRAILAYDRDGGRSGALPLSIGVRW